VKLAVTEAIRDIPGMVPDFDREAPFAGATGGGNGGYEASIAADTRTLFESAPRPDDPSAGGAAPVDSGAHQLAATEPLDRLGTSLRPDTPYNPELIWQVHNKYIFSQVASGVVMIDQHVAHERVLYEEALKAFEGAGLPSQTVLFPQVMELAPDAYSRLIDLIPSLERLGFRIREFGPHTIIVEGLPVDVAWGREREIITDILDRIDQHQTGAEVFERMAASYSCKAAVKAGDPLTLEEMRSVVDRLFATENPYYCPHGRPTVVHLSSTELDRRFERI
jgi:DNA mismatch repair protein MutL